MTEVHQQWDKAIKQLDADAIAQLLEKYPHLKNKGIVHYRGNGTTYETLPLNMVNHSLPATKLLIAAGADPNEKGDGDVLAIHNASLSVTKYLVSVGAAVNIIGYEACSPLMYEVYMHNYDNVRFLIASGAEVNYQRKTDGYTSLHYAVQKKDALMVDILLKAQADVHLKNAKHQTPLDIARRDNVLAILEKFKLNSSG